MFLFKWTESTIYPKKIAHSSHIAVFWCDAISVDFTHILQGWFIANVLSYTSEVPKGYG